LNQFAELMIQAEALSEVIASIYSGLRGTPTKNADQEGSRRIAKRTLRNPVIVRR